MELGEEKLVLKRVRCVWRSISSVKRQPPTTSDRVSLAHLSATQQLLAQLVRPLIQLARRLIERLKRFINGGALTDEMTIYRRVSYRCEKAAAATAAVSLAFA